VTGKPATFARTLQQAQRWADEFDMRVAIHNHGGKDWLGNSAMLRHVLDTSGPRVGVCIDTAWCIQAGEDPIKWAGETFAGRVFAVHYKDFLFDPRGKHRDVIIGEGSLDLPAFVTVLRRTGFDGPAVIEYEGDVENPVPALVECVKRIRPVLEQH
jgi:sugar phosphate isomerase/epimerase